jgi:exodeoxyribonuclease-3
MVYFVPVYTPNAQDGLKRLSTRMEWDDRFRAYVSELAKEKPVIICGDMNVAHQEIDLKNPSTNHQNAGFSDEERGKFTELLQAGFIDTFRTLYPDRKEAYSWWSYRFRSRERNAGWRIDYFLIRAQDKGYLKDHILYTDVLGSDHCPVGIITEGLCI